jgi:hypothetical protein
MEKFLFIPPVDDSMPPLNAGQWILLSASFLTSLTLFIAVMLAFPAHSIFGALAAFALGITATPMQIYAMNRKASLIGKFFLVAICGIALYNYRNWTRTHVFELSIVVLMALSVYWIIGCIDQVGNRIHQRLNELHTKVDAMQQELEEIKAKQDEIA